MMASDATGPTHPHECETYLTYYDGSPMKEHPSYKRNLAATRAIRKELMKERLHPSSKRTRKKSKPQDRKLSGTK